MRAAGGRVGRVDKSTHLGFKVKKYIGINSARLLGAADLIASRIPPGLGGSIARNNDNV